VPVGDIENDSVAASVQDRLGAVEIVLVDTDRRGDRATLLGDLVHRRGLFLYREEAVDNTQSAEVGQCGRGLGFGDGVHRRADDGDVQRERRRQLCGEVDVASTIHSRSLWNQQCVSVRESGADLHV